MIATKIAVGGLRARGNKFVRVSEKDAKKWRKATESVVSGWVKRMNGEGYDGELYLREARKLIKKYEKK